MKRLRERWEAKASNKKKEADKEKAKEMRKAASTPSLRSNLRPPPISSNRKANDASLPRRRSKITLSLGDE